MIYISSGESSEDIAEQLRTLLRGNGYKVYEDQPGQSISRARIQAIKDSIFVSIFSDDMDIAELIAAYDYAAHILLVEYKDYFRPPGVELLIGDHKPVDVRLDGLEAIVHQIVEIEGNSLLDSILSPSPDFISSVKQKLLDVVP